MALCGISSRLIAIELKIFSRYITQTACATKNRVLLDYWGK